MLNQILRSRKFNLAQGAIGPMRVEYCKLSVLSKLPANAETKRTERSALSISGA